MKMSAMNNEGHSSEAFSPPTPNEFSFEVDLKSFFLPLIARAPLETSLRFHPAQLLSSLGLLLMNKLEAMMKTVFAVFPRHRHHQHFLPNLIYRLFMEILP